MNKVIEAEFSPPNSGHTSSEPHAISESGTKEKRRILIVDDDPNSTHLVKVLLERSGHYLVMEENNARKAHQNAQNFRPDLILLDIMMPEEDGGELAEEIRADPALRNTPIIFLTALVTRDEAKHGLHIQGHPAVAKPISIPELIKAIEEQVAARSGAKL